VAFQVLLRGGRHRENLSVAEEDVLLEQFLTAAGDGGVIVVSAIKAAYEQKLGQSVPKSTVYRMLARHDWQQMVPRPRHPASDIDGQQVFKNASRKSSRSK
jgi:hypothetical protein